MTLSARFARVTGWLHKHRLPILLVALAIFALSAQHADAALDGAKAAISVFLSILGYVYTVIAFALGKLIVLLIGMIIIPILGYNDFGSSFIISIGWPLVRDVMNMFVILILILIAIKTILGIGGGASAAQQNIVKLFLAVVAMNFSRTICVLIIDFGQVVMMTFVNALQDIAAGNFVGLFQLNNVLGTTFTLPEFDTGGPLTSGSDAVGYLGSAYLMLVLMAIILGVIAMIAVVFIYRIVILWILVILSPLAFFLMGVPLEGAKSYAGEWRKKFVGAVTLGPILTFFLWLALATAGQGSIVATEGFPTAGTEDAGVGLLNDIFETDKLLSLLIGVLLLFVGLQAASSAANSLGSFSGQALKATEKFARRAVTAPAEYTYKAGRAGVREGFRQYEARTGDFSEIGKTFQRDGARITTSSAARIPIVGAGVRGFGRALAGTGSSLQGAMGAQYEERLKNSRERHQAKKWDQKVNEARIFDDPEFDPEKFELGQAPVDDWKTAAAEGLSSQKQQKLEREALRSEGKNEAEVETIMKERNRKRMAVVGGDLEDFYGGDEKAEEKAFRTKAANLDLLTEDEMREVVGDKRFSLALMGSGSAVNDATVQKILGEVQTPPKKNKDGTYTRETLLERLEAGGGGPTVQDAYKGSGVDKSFIRGDMPAPAGGGPRPAEAVQAWNAESEAKAKMVGRAMANGRMSVSAADLTTADLNGAAAGSAEIQNLAKALIEAKGQAKGIDDMDATIRASVVAKLGDMKVSATTQAEKLEIDKVIARVQDPAKNPVQSMDGYDSDGNFKRYFGPENELTDEAKRSERVIREIIREKPVDIRRFESAVQAGGDDANDTSRLIVQETSSKDQENLLKAYRSAQAAGDMAQVQATRDAARTLRLALTKELRAMREDISRISAIPENMRSDNDKKRFDEAKRDRKELQKREEQMRYTEPLMN